MNKRQKKKALSRSANLKKPISLMIDGKEIANVLVKYIMRPLGYSKNRIFRLGKEVSKMDEKKIYQKDRSVESQLKECRCVTDMVLLLAREIDALKKKISEF